jgi:hypothetical protein
MEKVIYFTLRSVVCIISSPHCPGSCG